MKVENSFQEPTVNQYTTKRRTSVLYDFSYVQKARFYVYSVDNDGKVKTTEGSGGLLDILYVQINPQSMKVSSDAARRVTSPRGNVKGEHAELSPKGVVEGRQYDIDDLQLTLTYNLYDEFSVGTMDGLLSIYCDDTHLKSRTATSLERLIELGRMDDVGVLFKWGPFEYFGAITTVTATYTSFSRFGHPLTADAEVTVKAFGYSVDDDGMLIKQGPYFGDDPMGSSSKAVVADITQSAENVETGILLTAITAEGALR